MIKQAAKYIENNTDLVIGTDLFAGFLPSDVQGNAVVLIETGGAPNFDLTDRQDKTIQVLSCAADYWTASANAKAIYDLLHGLAGVTLPEVEGVSYYVNTGEALSVPQSLGQDEKGRFVLSTNFVLRIGNA